MKLRNTFIGLWWSYLRQIRLTRSRIRTFRIVLSVVAIIISIILMYRYVWTALNQDVGLPPGISVQDPSLDASMLEDLNEERFDRVRIAPPSFTVLNKVFGS